MTQGQLQIFQDEEQRDFRTLEIDGEPWFVFADVCRALGLRMRYKITASFPGFRGLMV